jgi:hypothetical protein
MVAPQFEIVTGEKLSWIHGSIDSVEVTRASFKECDWIFRFSGAACPWLVSHWSTGVEPLVHAD